MNRPFPKWSVSEWREKVKARDIEAWQFIADLCFSQVRKLRPHWPEEDQRDIANESLVRIVEKIIHDFEIRAVRGFILGVVEGLCKDITKKKDPFREEKIDNFYGDDAPKEFEAAASPTQSFEEEDAQLFAKNYQLVAAYLDCAEKLKVALDRQVLQLVRSNLTHREIKARLPEVSNVAVHIHRIAGKIRRCIERNGYLATI